MSNITNYDIKELGEFFNMDFYNSLSEEGKKNIFKSMLNQELRENNYYVNKYGRGQLRIYDKDIENYKNYDIIKKAGTPYRGEDNQIRPTYLTGWDFLVREYTTEYPETVEDFNKHFEDMMSKWM